MTTLPTTPQKRSQLCHEGGRIHELVTTLLRSFVERHQTPQRVSTLLENLTEHLGGHFKDEEQAGLFDELVRRLPHRKREIDALQAEHERFLETLVHIHREVETRTLTPELWSELEATFRKFATDVGHHEARENELLTSAYEDDLGNKD